MLFIYTAGCMLLFCKKEILLFLFVQLRKSPRMSCNSVASPEKVLELWCKKSCKKWKKCPGKSRKVLEFESIFLLGTMDTAFSSFDSFKYRTKSNSPKEELKALHNLRKQKNLFIQKTDKGNTAVLPTTVGCSINCKNSWYWVPQITN